MRIRLSDEQRAAIQQHPNQVVQVVDEITQEKYVLMPVAVYKKLKSHFAGEYDPDDFMPLVHNALAEDLNAPGMELYDDYDAHRTTS